jgi:hypothetical protein
METPVTHGASPVFAVPSGLSASLWMLTLVQLSMRARLDPASILNRIRPHTEISSDLGKSDHLSSLVNF